MKVHKVKLPDGNQGYDVGELDYCCSELESDLITNGAAVILIDEGLCLRSNLPGPHRILKFCYNCGQEIQHSDNMVIVEAPIEEPKEPVRDPVKAKTKSKK
jgi:hypothetical protein